MAVVNASGTVVTAVLESTGYYSQAQILQNFNSFFVSGGALLYLIAIIGAIVSIAMYGSFRMIRYLLVGPGLLFFFVFTRTDIEPALWQMGKEEGKHIDKFLSGQLESYNFNSDEPAKVSWFFAWYTHIISDLIRSMNTVILKDPEKANLFFIAREQGYRVITQATIKDSNTINIVQDSIINNCTSTTSIILSLADQRFSANILIPFILKTIDRGRPSDYITVLSLISEYLELMTSYKIQKDQIMQPGEAMKRFIRQRTLARIYGETLGSETTDFRKLASPEFKGDEDEFADYIDEGRLKMTCENAWTVGELAVKIQAVQQEKELYRSIFYYWNTSAIGDLSYEDFVSLSLPHPLQLLVCESIVKKLYGGDLKHLVSNPTLFANSKDALWSLIAGGGCTLSDAFTIYMLKNTLMAETTFSESSRRSSGLHYSTSLSSAARDLDAGSSNWLSTDSATGHRSGSLSSNGLNIRSSLGVTVASKNDTTFNSQLDSSARNLMQQVFNYALQIPYWQGIILYLLATAYPFFAIVVVLPNRASSFFYIPLAWLWVKSWDVGFALVKVFDSIMWELLPGKSLTYKDGIDAAIALMGSMYCGFSDYGVTMRLRQASSGDAGADLYQHYFFVSLALFAVPSITGAIILKGRHTALASFTNDAEDYAQTSVYNSAEQTADPYADKMSKARASAMTSSSSSTSGSTSGNASGSTSGKALSSASSNTKNEMD